MSVHDLPPSVVANTWPGRLLVAPLNPAYAAYAMRQLDRSTANCVTGRAGSGALFTLVHVGAALVTASG